MASQANRKWKSHQQEKRLALVHVQRERRRTMKDDIRYEIILYWSKEDQAFIAEVPELPGCAADGASYQEAVANVEVVIQEWIETAQELGRPIPTPRGRLLYA
jgi:predicted RNase H-like HicB family nuclease